MRSSILPLIKTLLVLFFGTQVFASEKINVHVIDSYPFAYKGKGGEYVGTHYDYLKAISKRSGIDMKINITPRARIVSYLKSGKCDGVILFRNKKRDHLVNYLGMIREIKIIALARRGRQLNEYRDFYFSRKTGLLRDQFISKKFNSDKLLNRVELKDYTQMVNMLVANRLDLIAGNSIAIANTARKSKILDKIELPGFPLATKQQWFQISKRSPLVNKTSAIENAIKSLSEDGTFDMILTKHVGISWKLLNK